MNFINKKMEKLLQDVDRFDEGLKTILEDRSHIFTTDIIELNDMILWNERNLTQEKLQNIDWNPMMLLWDNVKSKIEFFGYNRIYLHDEFINLDKNKILGIGLLCFNYWKKYLSEKFPEYHFFLRFYYQEYDNGEFDSLVGFHKVRFTETLGSTDIIEMPNPAVMFAII